MPPTPGNNPDYRRAWSRFATGVTVVTSVEPDGTPHGMTANGITSVSLDPPLALVCVAHTRNTYRYIENTRRFGISVLAADQRPIAEYFARDPSERGGSPVTYRPMNGGHPCIKDALSSFACEVVSAHEEGDHTVYIGRVTDFDSREGAPLMWFESRFGGLTRRNR